MELYCEQERLAVTLKAVLGGKFPTMSRLSPRSGTRGRWWTGTRCAWPAARRWRPSPPPRPAWSSRWRSVATCWPRPTSMPATTTAGWRWWTGKYEQIVLPFRFVNSRALVRLFYEDAWKDQLRGDRDE